MVPKNHFVPLLDQSKPIQQSYDVSMQKVKLPSMPTKADGNCFFHAVFGNVNECQYSAPNADDMRKEWHNFLFQFNFLQDQAMPTPLKEQLKKILNLFLNNPDDLTGRSQEIKTLADVTKKRINDANIKVKNLKDDIADKFQDNLNFQSKIYQIIQEANNKENKQPPTVQELLDDKDRLVTEISNDLEDCALKFSSNLSPEQYKAQYNPQIIANAFLEDPGVYSNYLEAIKNRKYYVFFEEIPILASLAQIEITVYYNDGRSEIFKPNQELVGRYPKDSSIWGIRKKVVISHEDKHFSHVNPDQQEAHSHIRKSSDHNEGSEAKKPKLGIYEDNTANTPEKLNQINLSRELSSDDIMPNKQSCFLDKLEMPSEGLKLAEHGNIFQLNLLMLCLWRAASQQDNDQKKYKEFRLATEMPQAEKFDDIVLQYKDNKTNKWKFRLLQAKHKEGDTPSASLPKIKLRDLLSNDNEEAFSLQKYFHSYLKINQRSKENSIYSVFSDSEIEDVIVITNTDLDLAAEQKSSIFDEGTDFDLDSILETKKLLAVKPEILKFKPHNPIINKLKIIFENNSDFYKLVESLAEHISNYKQIDKKDIFKDYHYPLVNEILEIDVQHQSSKEKYILNLEPLIQTKRRNGDTLGEEATKIRDALIKEMAFRKGKMQPFKMDKNFGNQDLPEEQQNQEKLATSLANIVANSKTLTIGDFKYDHIALSRYVINIKTHKFKSSFIAPTNKQHIKLITQLRDLLRKKLEELTNQKCTHNYLKEIKFNISEDFGISTLSDDEKKLNDLAKKLTSVLNNDHTLIIDNFKYDHCALANEVIDVKEKTFSNIFINGQDKKDEKLSPESKKFRRILLDEFERQNIKIKINNQETTINKLKEDTKLMRSLFNGGQIEGSKGFAKVLDKSPKFDNVNLFVTQVVKLITNNKNQAVIELNKEIIKKVLEVDDEGYKTFNKNIKTLAGYVLIERFSKICFSTAFLNLKSDNLPKEINDFRNKFKEALSNNQFYSLFEYEFKFKPTFNTCEDGELYRKLPIVHNDQDVNDFFSHLKLIVNYSNRNSIKELLGTEIEDKFKMLDHAAFHSSFYEKVHNWIADRVGTFYTSEKFATLIQEIQDNLLLFTINGFNPTYFAGAAQKYKFGKYNILDKFLLGSEQVVEIIFQDLFLGHTRITHGFQELQESDDASKQYTRSFGHIFLYLKQFKDEKFRSVIEKILKYRSKFNLITIECDDKQQKIEEDSLYTILCEILDLSNSKKVLFITTKDNNTLAKRFANNHKYKSGVSEIDNSGVNDLTQDSQQDLLKCTVKLQGQEISINLLINESITQIKEIIDHATLIRIMKGDELSIGSDSKNISDFAGAYVQLSQDVNVERLISNLNKDAIFIISGIHGSEKSKSFIDKLKSFDTDIIDIINQNQISDFHPDTNNNTQILLDDHKFQTEHFDQLCRGNEYKTIYWITMQDASDNVSPFILQKIYNPDFYVNRQFNHFKKVIIKTKIYEQRSIQCILTEKECDDIFLFTGLDKQDDLLNIFPEDQRDSIQQKMISQYPSVVIEAKINGQLKFNQLVAQHSTKTVHWLNIEQNKQIVWIKSSGTLDNMRKYIDKKSIQQTVDQEFINYIKDTQVVIIADDPGMGKTTSLTTLCTLPYDSGDGERKTIFQSYWVISVTLKDHISTINRLKSSNIKMEDIINLCSETDSNLNEPFTKKILSFALKNTSFIKPILIQFDGFDEVLDQNIRDKIISFFKYLKYDSNIKNLKFWITTRLHYEHTLENALSTFTTKFEPLDDSKKKEFIYKFLKGRLYLTLSKEKFNDTFGDNTDKFNDETSQIARYAEAFIIKMKNIFHDDNARFIGTPLQLYLMLDGATKYFKAWIENEPNNDQSLNFDYLGDNMLSVYEQFINEKYNIYLAKIGIKEELLKKRLKITLDQDHQHFAESLIINSELKKSWEEFKNIVLSAGVIKSHGSYIEFIHPTFREYFGAQVFMNWIEESIGKLSNDNKQEYLLKEIFIKSDYQLIRCFINLQLKETHIKDEILKRYGKIIIKKLRAPRERYSFAHLNERALRFRDPRRRKFHHLLLNDRRLITLPPPPSINKCLYTAAQVAAARVNGGQHSTRFSGGNARKRTYFGRRPLRDDNSLIVKIFDNCIIEYNKQIMQFISNSIASVNKQKLYQLYYKYNFFEDNEKISTILQFYCHQKTLKDESPYISSRVPRYDARIQLILDILKNNLSPDQTYKILSCDNNERTALHEIIFHNHDEIEEDETDSFIVLRKIFSHSIIEANRERDALQLYVDGPLALFNSEKLILNTAKEILSADKMFKFLCKQDSEGQTVLHMAVKSNISLMHKLMIDSTRKQAEDQISDNVLSQEYIQKDDHYITLTKLILDIAKEKLSPDQMFEFLCKQDSKSQTVLHIACRQNKFTISELQELLGELPTDKRTQWKCIFEDALKHHYNSDEIICLIFITAGEKFSRDQMYTFLFTQVNEGYEVLGEVTENGNNENDTETVNNGTEKENESTNDG